MALIWGVICAYGQDETLILILGVIVGIIVTMFAMIHASEANKPIPKFAAWLIYFTWPISTFVVLIYCKGIKGLGIMLAYWLGFYILSTITALITYYYFI